jgi:hypothetical protein
MPELRPRRIALDIYAGDWCSACQFLDFVGVPDTKDRVPHCRLFALRLRRAAANSQGVLRCGDCVPAENRAKETP